MGRIVLDKVKKRFGDVTIIPPLDLEIEHSGEDEVSAAPKGIAESILRRNGAGRRRGPVPAPAYG